MNPKDKLDIGGNLGQHEPISSNIIGSSSGLSTGAATARARVDDKVGREGELNVTNVVNKVSDVASGIASKVSENYDSIKGTAGEYAESVAKYSRSNPGTVILTSVGIGLLIGYMLTPRKPRYESTLRCLVSDGLNLVMDRYF